MASTPRTCCQRRCPGTSAGSTAARCTVEPRRDGSTRGSACRSAVEERLLALPRQALELPFRARGRGAIGIGALRQQPERAAPARIARTLAGRMRTQPRGDIVADARVPAAVAAFDQVQPPAVALPLGPDRRHIVWTRMRWASGRAHGREDA